MDGRFDKKNKSQKEREIYKPGSGPLRKTDYYESRTFAKTEGQVTISNSRNEKNELDHNIKCFVNSNTLIDKEKKKIRKPDAGIYVPKHRSKMDSCNLVTNSNDYVTTCPPSDSKTTFIKERCNDFTNRRYEGNHIQSKSVVETKQFSRDNRLEFSQNWKDSTKENSDLRKLDSKESRDSGRCYFQNDSSNNEDRSTCYPIEYKNSNFNNRFGNERGERGNNGDKSRSGRNLTRRNSTNSLVLPEVFNSWPPRLQRKFLESKDLKAEDLDKYFKNKNNFSGSTNRDNRYSQSATSSKNNRPPHYKSGSRVKDSTKIHRTFPKSTKCNEISDSETSLPQEKVNDGDGEAITSNEKSWNSSEFVSAEHSDSGKSFVTIDNASDEPKSGDITDTKSIIDDNNEKFNWAEEVEREQKIAERNNSEMDERKKNVSNTADEQKDRKKRRSISHERKQPQRSRNISEGDNQNRKKEEDGFWQNSTSSRNTNESTTANSDGYLSWRRNKNPSPSRTRLGIMTRNYRQENKFESSRNSGEYKMKNNYTSDKDNVAGIIKIPSGPGIQPDVKCSPPVFPVPHFSSIPTKPIKQLYNPVNPKQPILVAGQSARACIGAQQHSVPSHYSSSSERTSQTFVPSFMDPSVTAIVAPAYVTDQHMMSKPAWYDAYSESFRSTHNAHLLLDISRADSELQTLLLPGTVIRAWDRIMELRIFLQDALKTLLTTDLKFCEAENVEQHMWKILFYNVIELLRKCIVDETVNSQNYKNLLFSLLEKGMDYFRSLLVLLERTYKIKIDDYLVPEPPSTKALGLGGLALISAQKIFLFLGDLARYKETTEESCNYINARQWYIKANQLNPRNGRPYNQLAILAVYCKKKFDAVYYYMRSLMSSNPFFTARDSLLALFDENRKKYEQIEKSRREMKEIKKQEKAREKESVINGSMLRKETWIRPDDGKRVQRTTSTSQECAEDSDIDELVNLPAAEINKRFLLSFLHVHGKLFSKVGMETLQEAAIETLKEFKVLLNHSPLPINTTRLLQLLSLNMFAIDNGQLKDPQVESGYHSAVQESALVISLQMFNLIINRCIQLLKDQLQQMKLHPVQVDWNYPFIVSADVQILLPAIKLWCDWLFCHSAVWNPPPSCQDYKINGCGDCWSRLAVLINLLEELNYQEILRKNGYNEPILIMDEGNDTVKISLDEDVALRGFTPLMCNAQPPVYTYERVEMTLAQICLRIHRILFFGTIFLCGIDPPVLKLHKTETGSSEYISVVEEVISPKDQSDNENAYGSWSENEDENPIGNEREYLAKEGAVNTEEEGLLLRKKELELIHQKREKYIKDKKETIKKDIAAFSIEMEIKPHYLIPDTNCFIDCLPELEKIVQAVSSTQRPLYSLMVPVIVLSELEGIAKGIRKDEKVTENAKRGLHFLQRSSYTNIKCVTTRGSVLPSTRFMNEEDYSKVDKNDDKILTTCLNLCKHSNSDDDSTDQPKKIYRQVVLITEDRNLRIKALSSNMPVQSVMDFITWAGLN